jgi:hypothetical protein
VRVRIEVVEQALRVERAAGSGDGDDNLQAGRMMASQLAAGKRV